jgi:hypothetical protein
MFSRRCAVTRSTLFAPRRRPPSAGRATLRARAAATTSASITVLPVTRIRSSGVPSSRSACFDRTVGGETQVGEDVDEVPVDLFRKRRVLASCAQPRLDVADGKLPVERGVTSCERARVVPLHEHEVGSLAGEGSVEAGERANRDVGERLSLGHDVEVLVRLDSKDAQDLVEHRAVLRRHDDVGLEGVAPVIERSKDRRHLDRLGPRPEDRHHLEPVAASARWLNH